MQIEVRPARPGDVPQIVRFIRDLAEYEKLAHEVVAREEALAEHLFGEPAACAALIAEGDGQPLGFALFHTAYSTFETAVYLHLEDLYVAPEARGKGLGSLLLGAVAAETRRRGCSRLQWAVLDWNRPAIGFYERIGARPLEDWRMFRLEGTALDRLTGG